MKTLNIKIPLSIAQQLDDREHLNPIYLTQFITDNLPRGYNLLSRDYSLDKPIGELSYNYTFKITKDLHKSIKLIALEVDLPMNELIGRLLVMYYR